MTTSTTEDSIELLAQRLEQLANQVRATPPISFQITENTKIRDVPGDDPTGNYNYRVVENAGPGRTVVDIRWQP